MKKKGGCGFNMSKRMQKLTEENIFMLNGHIISNINLIIEGHDNDPKDVVEPLIALLVMVYNIDPSKIEWPEFIMSVEESE